MSLLLDAIEVEIAKLSRDDQRAVMTKAREILLLVRERSIYGLALAWAGETLASEDE